MIPGKDGYDVKDVRVIVRLETPNNNAYCKSEEVDKILGLELGEIFGQPFSVRNYLQE